MNRVGVDTGGTFTDVVGDDGRIAKVPSSRSDPAAAVRRGIAELGRSPSDDRPHGLAHGTTVATNALLERRGARVALVTNEGMADLIEIGRQDRPSLYDIWADRPAPLVVRTQRYEVGGRLDAGGAEVSPIDLAGLAALLDRPGDVDAVAVCLLHADLADDHEREVVRVLNARGFDVTCSADVSPQFREYERTVTTALNAYLRPACRTYLRALEDLADDVSVMTSAGGLTPVTAAAELPVTLLLSGPAGGVRAAATIADACGYPDAITFDMGGTSTDVCLVLDGAPEPAGERSVAGLPVRQPSLGVHTIGAGGGSIARIDPGGALVVGPESAGAEPGPACYGNGGTEPTVTDADLVAGRIPSGAELPGLGQLDLEAARAALDGARVTADGVIAVVDAGMEQALRAVSVERGVDPTGLALVAFGGAGPLHACALADALGMATVIIPARAGVLSAVGLLASPRQHDVVRSWPTPTDHGGLDEALSALAAEAIDELERSGGAEDVSVETALDCRYAGQSHELRVPSVADFSAEHRRRNGYDRPGTLVEVVALRATARRPAPVEIGDLPPPERQVRVGPAVVAEPDCTIWVADGWRADPHARTGALLLTRTADAEPTPFFAAGISSDEVGASKNAQAALEPAALQVLISRLTGIADEMGAVLRRAAFSPNIKERADCSAALFTADGTLLVQAEHIPVHLGSMPASVRAAIDAFGDGIRPGDQVILNDPFAGGTHLNDITLVAPVFASAGAGEHLCGWVANRAHHADLGGAAPGSIPADAVEIQQEGLRIPPARYGPAVRAIVLASSRTPDERGGDLDAQVGANVLGVERFGAFAAAPLDEVVAYGERRMRAALAALSDGTWAFEDVLDSFGPSPEQQRPTRIRLAVTIEGEAIRFDFTGTEAQTRGNVNAVEAVTVSAVAFALRSALDPSIPANGGALRPVAVVTPQGSVVAADFPAAVGAGNVEVSQRVADVCLGALAGAVPQRVGAASQGTMNNVLIGGSGWVYYETLAGGQGGRPPPATHGMSGVPAVTSTSQAGSRSNPGMPGQSGIDTSMTNTSQADDQSAPGVPGQSGIHTCMTNTKNTPIEALERAFPMRVLRYRLRRGSGGAGSAPGGEGIERDLEMLQDVTVSLITERRVSQPWGLADGEPGAVGENWLLPAGDESRAEPLRDKCTIRLRTGDVLRMLTPGGGGWGRSNE